MRTFPLAKSVAVSKVRDTFKLPAAANVPVEGS